MGFGKNRAEGIGVSLEVALADLKEYRRNFANELASDLDHNVARKLGEVHLAIMAIEAVLAEPAPTTTGPKIEFGQYGWPVDPT